MFVWICEFVVVVASGLGVFGDGAIGLAVFVMIYVLSLRESCVDVGAKYSVDRGGMGFVFPQVFLLGFPVVLVVMMISRGS